MNRLVVDFEKDGLKKDNNETFKEIYDLWLETYQTTVKDTTAFKIGIKFDKWILPVYGDLQLKNVTVKHAQSILVKWSKETNQYKILHSTASRVFTYAVNLGIIENNTLTKVIVPKQQVKEQAKDVKVYTRDEIKHLFSYLNSQPQGYKNDFNKMLIRTMLYSGARVSELLALEWQDIDFMTGSISITKTLSQTKYGYKVSTPKNKGSYGDISMDAQTMKELKRWQVNQRKYMLTIGITEPNNVFCGIYKQVIIHHAIYIRLKTITNKCDIPFLGDHVFRHTCASLLLDSGATMKEVQDRLRHSSIKITMDNYSHLSKETKEKTVEKLVKHLDF